MAEEMGVDKGQVDVHADFGKGFDEHLGAEILAVDEDAVAVEDDELDRRLVEALVTAGLRERVRVIVGGAPASESWAKEIGADGYSEDAIGAVALARKLLGDEAVASA